jgi:hypothetical protein
MSKFNETKAVEQPRGKYDIDGWIKLRDLEGVIFDIVGMDTRPSSFDSDATEYVMIVKIPGVEDREHLELPEPEDGFGVFGVSTTHYRVVRQLKKFKEENFPVEDVTVGSEVIENGTSMLFLADPTTSEETKQESTQTSPKQNAGKNSGSTGNQRNETYKTGSNSHPERGR